MMLHPKGIGIPDYPPPFRYALPQLPSMSRVFVEFIEIGLSDDEAWEALFDPWDQIGARRPKQRKTR